MTDASSGELFLGRQPILDRHQQIVAYELLFRSGARNAADFADGAMATATVIANAFSELSVGDAIGPYRGFINVDEAFLFSDVLELLPRQSVVLEILETVRVTPSVVDRCRELRTAGFTLALDDVVQLGDDYRPLFDLIDIVKVDLQPLDRAAVGQLASRIRALGVQALAEKVDSQEQMNDCLDCGFSLFQGYFFARPVIIKGRKLDPSQLALMQLMNLVLTDADDAEIEKVLKQEPGLTLNLLRMTNSVAVGAPVRITTLRQALQVLGRRQLQRWLQLLLYAGSGTPARPGGVSPLLQLAATRGRLMELLAARIAPRDAGFADHAFMTGILSLTPALLGMPIADILAQLALDAESRAALAAPEARSGRLGALLTLTERIEDNDDAGTMEVLSGLAQLDPPAINRCLSQALSWANNIGREP